MRMGVAVLGLLIMLNGAALADSIEARPFPVCALAERAHVIVRARIARVGSPIKIPSVGNLIGGVFTPLEIESLRKLRGDPPALIYVRGDALAKGGSDLGPTNVGREGVFFLVQTSGKYYVHASGGFLWKDNELYVSRFYPFGISETEVLAGIESTGVCELPAIIPAKSQAGDGGAVYSRDGGT